LEAAAAGLPVVFRDLPEYRQLYEHPYLKAASQEEFRALLTRLISDQNFLEKSKKVSSILLTQFERQAIRKKMVDLYREVFTASFAAGQAKKS
jgi:1,2-diacylglycerol-3-alpha-glucose alpha-1,2-galactosyltransferase